MSLADDLDVRNSDAGGGDTESVPAEGERSASAVPDEPSPAVNPWHAHAVQLADWAVYRYFVRKDRFGGYMAGAERSSAITRPAGGPRKNALTMSRIIQHFRATSPSDVIGAHTLNPEYGGGRYCGADIDAHPGTKADPEANEQFALAIYAKASAVGLSPLVYESNGKGGYHAVVFFDVTKPHYVPGPVLYGLAQWLTADYAAFGFAKRPETFPKQRTLPKDKYGNWLRLVGRHHTRDFWPRVWNGSTWLEGEAAVRRVLSTPKCDQELIPHEARALGAVDAHLVAATPADPSGGRPGDEFNTRGGIQAAAKILSHFGWTLTRDRGDGVTEWARPGKTEGCSGTLGFCDAGGVPRFYCWTDAAAPLEPNKAYTPFALLAFLEYGGDFAAAAAEAAEGGFGSKGTKSIRVITRSDQSGTNADPAVDENRPRGALSKVWGDKPDNPHRLAAELLGEGRPGGKPYWLRFWRETFYEWTGSHYRKLNDARIKATVTNFARRRFLEVYKAEQAAFAESPEEGKKPPVTIPVTIGKVNDVVHALKGLCAVPDEFETPCWLDGETGPDPRFLLAAPNGLFDLSAAAAAAGGCHLSPGNPALFNTTAVNYAIDPSAPPPVAWGRFLEQLWRDDEDSVNLLQEWFGYALSGDTSMQKMLWLIGPSRAGKGVINHVLTGLVGVANVATPGLHDLGSEFGLSSLVGKSLAVVGDGRLSNKVDRVMITARLLQIVGEDGIDVNRKHKPIVENARLGCRVVVAANELPALVDQAEALLNRSLILKFSKTFVGKEDTKLKGKLTAELPGILKWAVDGLARLRKQERFTQPASGGKLKRELSALLSPVGEFVRERCIVGAGEGFTVGRDDLFAEWRRWCDSEGRKEHGTKEIFGRDLRSAVPDIDDRRKRNGTQRVREYVGIRLRREGDPDPLYPADLDR
jgi:P4 family phage/plasmid primase-like protien